MRYAQGGGLTAGDRERRERVRMQAVKMFGERLPTARIARELRVTARSVCRWRQAWLAGGTAGLASRGQAAQCRLACYRPGFRARLISRYHEYHGRRTEKKAFTWQEYRDLVTAAHRQLPGGKIVLIRDNLNIHAQAEKLALNGRSWLRIYRLPPYAPTSVPSRASGPR